MLSPYLRTFQLLGSTENPSAVDVLLFGLHASAEPIRLAALDAVLKRRNLRGLLEIIRSVDTLTPAMRRTVEANSMALTVAISAALQNGNFQLRVNAVHVVGWLRDFQVLPLLVPLLLDPDEPLRPAALSVFSEMVLRLSEHLQFGREHLGDPGANRPSSPGFLRDADRIRHNLLTQLEAACLSFHQHQTREIVEAILILSGGQNVSQRVLRDFSADVRSAAELELLTNVHPAVITLVLDSMNHNYPLAAHFAAIEQRTDTDFVTQLLKNWPRKLSSVQQKNLSEIQRLAWLEGTLETLELIPQQLHGNLIAMLTTVGIPDDRKLATLEWLVLNGDADTRMAATAALDTLRVVNVQGVVMEGLSSPQPEIQAWATTQLRPRAVQNAILLLLERVDSPMPEVRTAARNELSDFNLERVLSFVGRLDASAAAAVGQLLLKTDPQAITKLSADLEGQVRSRRIRAAQAAVSLRLHDRLVSPLCSLLSDADALVRRVGIESLQHSNHPLAVEMVSAATRDSSQRVRETAVQVLTEWKTASEQQRARALAAAQITAGPAAAPAAAQFAAPAAAAVPQSAAAQSAAAQSAGAQSAGANGWTRDGILS